MHGAVEHHRRGHAAGPQSADEGRGLPVTIRHRSPAALAAWRAAAAACHLGRRPGLVDDQQTIRHQRRLEFTPGPPAPQDLLKLALAGVRDFLYMSCLVDLATPPPASSPTPP